MSYRSATGAAAALVAALVAGSLPAVAQEAEACARPALLRRRLDRHLGDDGGRRPRPGEPRLQPKIDILSVAVTYEALPRGDIDIFLGNWMPLQVPIQKPLVDAGKIEVVADQPRGRDHRLRRAEGGL